MRNLARLLAAPLALVAFVVSWPALAETPLVSFDWLKANLGKQGMVVLDVRSGAGVTRAVFARAHIPGAVYTDYAKDGWREKNKSGVDGMLPPPEKLEKLIGGLGISNQTHVVIVPEGRTAADVATATRVYWTFKVMGHDSLSILNGGFKAWTDPVDKATRQPLNPLAADDSRPQPAGFKASFRPEMYVSAADVEAARAKGRLLVDNRPHDFFVGLNRSPAAKRAGTIPGAVSLPEGWFMVNGGGMFRPREQLLRLYKLQGVPIDQPHIAFCNTGHWATLGWFVAHEIIGNRSVVAYDGSMAEWTQDIARPVEQRMEVECAGGSGQPGARTTC